MEDVTLRTATAVDELTTHKTTWVEGKIIEISDGKFVVQTQRGLILASKAFSCLVDPEIDDQILLFITTPSLAVLTSILYRPDSQEMCISLDQNTKIESSNGNLTLMAQANLEFWSPKLTKFYTQDFKVNCKKCDLNSSKLTAYADTITLKASKARLFLEQLETVVENYSLHARNCYRWVRGCEQLKIGQWIVCVKKTFSLRSRQAVMQAKQDIKIDGERVHLG